jgi:hypothetical protein
MAISGGDGELTALSLSANALPLSPPTDPRSTDMFRILQIIPKQKQIKKSSVKNNDTTCLIYINKMLVCSLTASSTTF